METKNTHWNFLLCSECGTRIALSRISRPFVSTVLCPSCVDDLFLTSEIVDPVENWPSPPRDQQSF